MNVGNDMLSARTTAVHILSLGGSLFTERVSPYNYRILCFDIYVYWYLFWYLLQRAIRNTNAQRWNKTQNWGFFFRVELRLNSLLVGRVHAYSELPPHDCVQYGQICLARTLQFWRTVMSKQRKHLLKTNVQHHERIFSILSSQTYSKSILYIHRAMNETLNNEIQGIACSAARLASSPVLFSRNNGGVLRECVYRLFKCRAFL